MAPTQWRGRSALDTLRFYLPGDDLSQSQLIDIDGVQVIQFLVPADGVHIYEQALALAGSNSA